MEKKTKVFRKIVLLHSHSQRFFANVSLKFSNINNRRVTSAYVAILLSFMQLIEEYLLATFFIIRDPYDINGQLRQKSMTSYRRNERCQRPKTSWFDLSFLLLSRTNISLKTFFRSLWKVWVLCDFLNLSCLSIISIFLLNASWVTELVNFIFHIMKISNFRHKLAVIKWCVFKVLEYRWQNEIYNWHLKSFCRQKLKFPWHRQCRNRNINGDFGPLINFLLEY